MISELQLSLLIIGGLFIAGIFVFNRLQERKYKNLQDSFNADTVSEDVLKKTVRKKRVLDPKMDTGTHPEKNTQDVTVLSPNKTNTSHSMPPSISEKVRVVPAKSEHRELHLDDLVEKIATQTELNTRELKSQDEKIKTSLETSVKPPVVEERPAAPVYVKVTIPPLSNKLFDPRFFYIAELDKNRAIEHNMGVSLEEIQKHMDVFITLHKRVHLIGFGQKSRTWEKIDPKLPQHYLRMALGVQLVDRTGALAQSELNTFVQGVNDLGKRLDAEVILGESQNVLNRAQELDQFCASIDIGIGLNLLPNHADGFSSIRIAELAQSVQLRFNTKTQSYHALNPSSRSVFSLIAIDNAPLNLASGEEILVSGLTFLLEVPTVANGLQVFDHMYKIARDMATALDATLVDDNHHILTENSMQKIREQLTDIYQKMEKAGMPAGGNTASILFV